MWAYIPSSIWILFRLQKVRKPAFRSVSHLRSDWEYINRDLFWFSHPGRRCEGAESGETDEFALFISIRTMIRIRKGICGHSPSYITMRIAICIQFLRGGAPSPYLTEPAFSARPFFSIAASSFSPARPRLFRPPANPIHTKEKPAGVLICSLYERQ